MMKIFKPVWCRVSFWAKTNKPRDVIFELRYEDQTLGSDLFFIGEEWKKCELEINIPAKYSRRNRGYKTELLPIFRPGETICITGLRMGKTGRAHENRTNIARFWYFGCGILIIGRASERSGAFEFLEKHHERDHMLDHYPEIMQGVQILE